MELFASAKPIAQISTQILSVDCFLDGRSDKVEAETEAEGVVKLNIGIRIFF